jgi:hypothetical protein
MKTLSRETNNLGGLSRLWCIPPGMILQINPDGITGLYSVVVYSLGSAWSIQAIPESLEYTEVEKSADAGSYFETELTGRLAKDTPDLYLALKDLRRKPWVVVYLDQNGLYKLIGNRDQHLWFSTELRTGAQYSGLNHIRFAFRGSLTTPGIFLKELPEGM